MIINLTQHPATQEQLAAGVVDLTGDQLAALKDALTFDSIPDREDLEARAEYISDLAVMFNGLGEDDGDDPVPESAMIGSAPPNPGEAPYLMAPLERALISVGVAPVYAFSIRESEEVVQPDGSVRKGSVFRHVGFVGV